MIKLSNLIDNSNQNRALVLRGLPYKVNSSSIRNFFKDCEIQNVFIEEYYGKRTGSAAVLFVSQSEAEYAKVQFDRKEIDGRYVELFD